MKSQDSYWNENHKIKTPQKERRFLKRKCLFQFNLSSEKEKQFYRYYLDFYPKYAIIERTEWINSKK